MQTPDDDHSFSKITAANAGEKKAYETSREERRRYLIKVFLITSLLLATAVAAYFIVRSEQNSNRKAGVYSEADGTVPPIADYIRKNETKFPESFVPVYWSKLRESKDLLDLPTYQVAVIYKVKNDEGVTVMKSKLFELNADGTILLEIAVEPFKFSTYQSASSLYSFD